MKHHWILITALAIGGCRDYEDAAAERLDDFDVLAGRATPRLTRDDIIAGHFVSTDDDLVPLRDHLRTMAWDIHGDILSTFTLTLPPGFTTTRTGSHATGTTSYSIDVATLIAQTDSTPGTAVANMVVPPTFSLATARAYLDHLNFTLQRSMIDVRWATTGLPVLEIHLPLDVDVDPQDWLPVDPPNGHLDLVVDVGFGPTTRTGAIRFADFFGTSRPLRDDYVVVSLGLHVGSLTGLGDYLELLRPTVNDVVAQVGSFLATLRTPMSATFPVPPGAWAAWCAGRIGGCPFSAAALDRLQMRGALHSEHSTWHLLDGRGVTLRDTNVFDQAMLDVLATGGTMSAGQLGDPMDAQTPTCDRCSDGTGDAIDCAICGVCHTSTEPQVRSLCDGRLVPITITGPSAPACPLIAELEEGTFAVAEQLRNVAARPAANWGDPVHPVVYSAIAACPADSGCAAGVEFSFPNDEDGDGVPWIIDNCPIFNPDQRDRDGDGRGDACDPCPFTPGWDPTDSDGDGIPDLCDCDADNDGCTNRVVDGAGRDLCTMTGETWDEHPRIANPFDTRDHDGDGNVSERLDWDGDGIMDDCDLDDDGDGVPDAIDNCHWVSNPGQEDTDGNHVGDACDPWCTGPHDPHCGSGPFLGTLSTIGWLERLGHLPAMPLPPWCIVDGPGCMFVVSVEIPVQGLPVLVLRDGLDGNVYRFDTQTLGVPSLDGGIVAVPDLDHDGRPDLAIGVPSQERVVAVSSATGKTLWSWPSPVIGRAGAALATDGKVLWVGVPNAKLDAQTSPGAVLQLDFGSPPRATRLVWGSGNGEQFGATLDAARIDNDSLVAVGAPYAFTAKGKSSGRFTVLDGRARPMFAIDGLASNAGPGSRASLVAVADKLKGVAVGASSYGAGAGAIAVYDAAGKLTWVAAGAAGDRLGTSLAILPTPQGSVVVGGAPGANAGGGAVSVYALAGGLLETGKGVAGAALGTGIAALPDLDRDGAFELAIGGTNGYTVLSTKK